MKKWFLTLLLGLSIHTAGWAQEKFGWINPIYSGIDDGGLRDCFVFRAEGKWYLTGTSSPHWGDGYGNPGVRLYRSTDLINWREVGLIVKNPGTSKWYASRFWAPEIAFIKGKYYCTFNCRNERDGFNVQQSWGIAVADNVEGPYTVLSDEAPLELNLVGTVLPTQIFLKPMVEQKKGAIVNFSSMAAFRPLTRVCGYASAKAGISNFTAYMATEIAKKFGEGIRINAIAPGFFLTEQNRSLLTNPDGTYTQRGQDVIRQTPFGRMGRPEELCGTIQYLISEASSFVTGTVAIVDGGFNTFAM